MVFALQLQGLDLGSHSQVGVDAQVFQVLQLKMCLLDYHHPDRNLPARVHFPPLRTRPTVGALQPGSLPQPLRPDNATEGEYQAGSFQASAHIVCRCFG